MQSLDTREESEYKIKVSGLSRVESTSFPGRTRLVLSGTQTQEFCVAISRVHFFI